MLSKRTLLASVAALSLMSLRSEAAFGIFQVNGIPLPSWQTLKLGAGGQITSISMNADGTQACCTDVGGAYVRNTPTSAWVQTQLVPGFSATSAAPAAASPGGLTGAVELIIAPSNSSVMMLYWFESVYVSLDKGKTWIVTPFGGTSSFFSNANMGNNKFVKPHGAIDPINPDIAFIATETNGLWTTSNLRAGASSTWTQVTAVGTGTLGNVICFDPTSSTASGFTHGIYTGGTGGTANAVWHSTDGGATWTKLNSSGMPTTCSKMTVDQFGVVWIGNATGIFRYLSGAWITSLSTTSAVFIAVDPTSNSQATSTVYCLIATAGAPNSGAIAFSTDGGGSWTGASGYTLSASAPGPTWPSFAADASLSPIMMAFDPSQANTLLMAGGIGVWKANPVASATAVAWSFDSTGIEELVMNWGVKPPGGNLVVAAWDRPVWVITNPKVYPSRYYPNNTYEIVPCWSIDWCSSDPTTLVAVLAGIDSTAPSDISGVLTSGGTVYTQFAGKPSVITGGSGTAGCIAASTPSNFVWMPNGTAPYYTLNGGATWLACATGQAGTGGWAASTGATKHMRLAADRVAANTFYMYNDGSGTNSADKGIYKSTDGGATWTHVYTTTALGNVAVGPQMRTVPGKTGELFFSPGPEGPDLTVPVAGQDFQFSQNGGTTWSVVPNTSGAWGFGFGKQIGSYPTIFMYGFARANSGAGAYALAVWQSNDLGTNWKALSLDKDGNPTPYIGGSFDYVCFVEGDDQIAAQCYVGFQGTSCKFYGT